MEKNKLNLGLVVLTVFLFSVLAMPSVIAVDAGNMTIVAPANDTNLSGALVVWNISTVDSGDYFVDLENCTIYLQSANTGNSTYIADGTDINSTASDSINGTIDTTVFEDGTSYWINISCRNVTDQEILGYGSGFIIDNTVPTAASAHYPTGAVDNQTFEFGATVVNSTITDDCTLFFDGINPGSPSYTMTSTGDVCTYSTTLIPEQTYRWYVRASDGTNTTDSSVVTTNVDVGSSTAKIPALLDEPGVTSGGGATLTIADTTTTLTTTLTTKVGGIPIWVIIAGVVAVVAIVLIKRR